MARVESLAMCVAPFCRPLMDLATHKRSQACGLYWKLHGKYRPTGLNKPTIKRRKRVAPAVTQVRLRLLLLGGTSLTDTGRLRLETTRLSCRQRPRPTMSESRSDND